MKDNNKICSPCVSKDAAITQSVEMLQNKTITHSSFTISEMKPLLISPAACSAWAATTGAAARGVPCTHPNGTTTPLSGARLQPCPIRERNWETRGCSCIPPGLQDSHGHVDTEEVAFHVDADCSQWRRGYVACYGVQCCKERGGKFVGLPEVAQQCTFSPTSAAAVAAFSHSCKRSSRIRTSRDLPAAVKGWNVQKGIKTKERIGGA